MNWFKPVYTELSDITDPQRRHGHIKLSFSFILCKINVMPVMWASGSSHCEFSFGTYETKTSIRQLLWGFPPQAVKLMAKSDISISFRPSMTAQLAVASSD